MNLKYRIDLCHRLGEFISQGDEKWQMAKEKAFRENGWFTPEFIDLSIQNITSHFLQKDILEKWAAQYNLPEQNASPKTIGLVMAGNIPMVGFHDLLCIFISGNKALIKTSSKDNVLIPFLIQKLIELEPAVAEYIQQAERLKNCDAYIATGSNNSSRYFDYYFGKYPNIIRRNRTSAAILTGKETAEELLLLADDVFLYFGLGCRNVTKLYVPKDYDFIPLLNAFKKYDYLADHNKYKNNYDYNLALYILNNRYYMSTPAILLTEDVALFSPISQLNYEFYTDEKAVTDSLKNNPELQCLVGQQHIAFGNAQQPCLTDYADGVDTMQFLLSL